MTVRRPMSLEKAFSEPGLGVTLIYNPGNRRSHSARPRKNTDLLKGKAVAHNLIKRAFCFQQQQKQADKQKKKTVKMAEQQNAGKVWVGVGQGARVSGACISHKGTNIFRKWQHLLTFAK